MKETIFDPDGLEQVVNGSETYGLFKFSGAAFWTSNSLYFLVISIIAIPMTIQLIWTAVLSGNTPARYLVEVSLVALVPVVAIVFVCSFGIHKDNRALLRFFVATEVPIATLLLMRSAWFTELSIVAGFLYVMVLWVSFGNALLVVRGLRHATSSTEDQPPLTIWGSALSASIAAGGLYISLIVITMLAPLTVGIFIVGLVAMFYAISAMLHMPAAIIVVPMGAMVSVLGAWCFLVALYSPWCYCEQWVARMKVARQVSHAGISVLVLLVLVVCFLFMSQQSQRPVLELVETNQTVSSDQIALLQQDEKIKSGLLNAYLGSLRHIPDSIGWSSSFPHPIFTASDWVLQGLLKPMMYHGNPVEDRLHADAAYEEMFDAPIQRAERESVLAAVQGHWSAVNDSGAGLIDIDQRRIHVESQDITTVVEGGVATISVQEALLNKTPQRLESLMYFTLPVDAVVTGLWLSDTEAELEKFAFRVAPRGAAQQVYKEEVAMRVDPALLEKVGPQQYRLRVFPVLPNSTMHVKLEYQAVPNEEQQWPLPALLEQRNVYWSKDTKRTINGQVVSNKRFAKNVSEWIPSEVAVSNVPVPNELGSSLLSFADGETEITAISLADYPLLTEDNRIAVLVDGSYSMQVQLEELLDGIETIENSDLFFCKGQCVKTSVEQRGDWVFFGNSQPLEQLATFYSEFDSQEYEGVLLLSDGGTYEFDEVSTSVKLSAPTWLALTGAGAHAFHDTLLDTLRGSGGGVANSVSQALVEFAVLNSSNMQSTPLGVSGDRLWIVRPASADVLHNPALSEIATALKIEGLSRGKKSLHPTELDELHAMALEQGVVSRFSSMIVLVNQRQKSRLAALSEQDDRFQREVESGKQENQSFQSVPAVPEPHEWALLLLGMMMLSMITYKRAREEQWTMAMVRERVRFELF